MRAEDYKPFDVPVPWRLKKRPVHRGFPVPYLVRYFDGVPDFRVSDEAKWLECTERKLCGLCGMKLDLWKWFIGGVRSTADRLYYDPPSHEDCALYAMKVCPYLAMVRGYSLRAFKPDANIKIISGVNMDEQKVMGLAKASNYRVVMYGSDKLIQASKFAEIHWYRDGKEITEAEYLVLTQEDATKAEANK